MTLPNFTREAMPKASVLIALISIAVFFAPTDAHATHPAGGNCRHTHPLGPGEPLFSECTGGARKCTVGGVTGTCGQQGRSCICKTTKDQRQELSIDRMFDATQAALLFPSVVDSVGQAAACNQLSALVPDFLLAKTGVLEDGPITLYDPNLLHQLDFVIGNLAQVGGFASTCGISLPVETALEFLVQMKQQIVDSFFNLSPVK